MLPEGSKPSRENVLRALNTFNSTSHWHSLRRPSLDPQARRHNELLLKELGVLSAEPVPYGRLSHRTTRMPLSRVVDTLLKNWQFASYSPDWRHQDIVAFLERQLSFDLSVPVMLMELEDGLPRRRDWDEQTGFINLFQGPDPVPEGAKPAYPGDRYVLGLDEDPSQLLLQVHHVQPKTMTGILDLYTIAVHLGDRANIRRDTRRVA
jgi:hypothetical protein